MVTRKGTRKVCNNGHVFYKSSDCHVCPVCEKQQKPASGFLSEISAPARRALQKAGIITLSQLSKTRETDILKLHGMGPATIPRLRNVLKQKGMNFKK